MVSRHKPACQLWGFFARVDDSPIGVFRVCHHYGSWNEVVALAGIKISVPSRVIVFLSRRQWCGEIFLKIFLF